MKLRTLTIAAIVALPLTTAHAYDARTMAMGGAGVATAHGAAAISLNPALLQKNSKTLDIALGVELNVSDIEDSIDAIEKLSDSAKDLERNINSVSFDQFKLNQHSAQLASLSRQADKFNQRFKKLNGGLVNFNIKPGLGFAYHCNNCDYGYGLLLYGNLQGTAVANISKRDTDKFQALVDLSADGVINSSDAARLQSLGLGNYLNPNTNNAKFKFKTFDSESDVIAVIAAQSNTGFGIARGFELANGDSLAVGATPKIVTLLIADKIGRVNNFDDGDSVDKRKTGLGLDLGASYKFAQIEGLIAAVALKDLISHQLKSSNNITAEAKPQLTAAIAYEKSNYTLAFDLDLNKQQLIKDSNYATQFASFGAEFAPVSWFALRAGYRSNLESKSNIGSRASLGLGLLGGVLDLAYFVGDDDEKGIALRTGFSF